jgi:hypothetical protein
MPSAYGYADGYRPRNTVGIGLVGSSRMAVGVAMAVGVEWYSDGFVWPSARHGRRHSGSHGTQENGRQGYADGQAHGLPYTWQWLVALLVKIC